MLPQASLRPWFAAYDAFRTVPKDFSEATVTGAVMTVLAALVCTTLFLCEVTAFLTVQPTTRIVVDSNQDTSLQINFDVTMLDIVCDHVTVGVWDAFGTERMNVTKDVQKQRIDHKGVRKGAPYTEDELLELEFSEKSFTAEELSELDSDWTATSDNFKHDSFQSVIDAHDYVIVDFYADWCSHCLHFAPTWKKFEDSLNAGETAVVDADGAKANVRALKINCVDFETTCQEQRVHSFPSVRLYKRGAKEGEFQEFDGPRELEGLNAFVQREVKKRHLHTGATYHNMFSEGCRISGKLQVARVPGTVHFQAANTRTHEFNAAFTNVSHTVHHFSFGEAPRRSMKYLPEEYKRHVNPLDGRSFTVDKFHKAPNHFIKVVHTRFETSGVRSYQQTHQWSTRTLQRTSVPQAKFSYDLAPVEVVVSNGDRRWYDLVTKIFAIIGGAYSVMAMTTGVAKVTAEGVKSLLGKQG